MAALDPDAVLEPVQLVICDTVGRWYSGSLSSEDLQNAVVEAAVTAGVTAVSEALGELVSLAFDVADTYSDDPQALQDFLAACERLGS